MAKFPVRSKFDEQDRKMAELVRQTVKAGDRIALDRNHLALLGEQYWGVSYKKTNDDQEALNRICDFSAKHFSVGHVPLNVLLASPGDRTSVMNSALWYHQGLNQIVLGHKMAAALLATKVNPEAIKDVRPPWRAFYLSLPDKMFFAQTMEGGQVPVYGVLVAQLVIEDELQWQFVAVTNTSLTLWRHGYTNAMMADDSEWDFTGTVNPFSEEVADLDSRTVSMLGRLIINVCLAMNDPTNIKSQPKEGWHGWGSQPRSNRDKFPKYRTHVLSKETILDCRDVVMEYLRTGKKRGGLTVQTLVSGHYKSQTHGAKNSLRKIIWIEPFWRGPDDAPILSHAHTLKTE